MLARLSWLVLMGLSSALFAAQGVETVFVSRAHPNGITTIDPQTRSEADTHPPGSKIVHLSHPDGSPVLYGVQENGTVFGLNVFTDTVDTLATGFVSSTFSIPGKVIAHPGGSRLFGTAGTGEIVEFSVPGGSRTAHPVGTLVGILDVSSNGRTVYFIEANDGMVKAFDSVTAGPLTQIADVGDTSTTVGRADPRSRFFLLAWQEPPTLENLPPAGSFLPVTVARVDLGTHAVDTLTLPDADYPRDLVVAPDGSEAYVIVAGQVRAIDLGGAAMSVRTHLSMTAPFAAAVAEDGTVWVVEEALPYAVTWWDPASGMNGTVPLTSTQTAITYDVAAGELPHCYDPVDSDADGIGDDCDNCPVTSNVDQRDTDGDGLGDGCDDDIDNDGIPNVDDNCPYHANPDQSDLDADGTGDVCEIFDKDEFLRFMDVRLQALAQLLAEIGIDGPWGPWGPFTECRWDCESLQRYDEELATGYRLANAYLARTVPRERLSEGDLLAVLTADGRASPDMARAYLQTRIAPRETPSRAVWLVLALVVLLVVLAGLVWLVGRRATRPA